MTNKSADFPNKINIGPLDLGNTCNKYTCIRVVELTNYSTDISFQSTKHRQRYDNTLF
jgi:hypothetical protein